MIRVAVVASNYAPVKETTKKGTEFLVYSLLTQLHRQLEGSKDFSVVAFASGDSSVPFPLISVDKIATTLNPLYGSNEQKLAELALISKAFAMQDQFDVYHFHIWNGEYVLPFAQLCSKPVLITLYGKIPDDTGKNYLKQFQSLPNVWFVSVIPNQQRQMPFLQYAATIPHGIDITRYLYNEKGGDDIMWAGRAIKEKGCDIVLDIAERTRHGAKIFPIIQSNSPQWFNTNVIERLETLDPSITVQMTKGLRRYDLASYYQKSKLFLFPLSWEEPFGLVMIESMASGTPIVAYARGSTPDIVIDGVTGFLVNESDSDIRGKFIIKKTGVNGLIEAVERIYNMNEVEYLLLRQRCRAHAERNYSIGHVVRDYLELYKTLTFGRTGKST